MLCSGWHLSVSVGTPFGKVSSVRLVGSGAMLFVVRGASVCRGEKCAAEEGSVLLNVAARKGREIVRVE